jgi:hypothetical protein
MEFFALTKQKMEEVGKVENPTHVQCGNPLERLNDGRYKCVHCLMAGFLVGAEAPRPARGVDTRYVGFHIGGDPFTGS